MRTKQIIWILNCIRWRSRVQQHSISKYNCVLSTGRQSETDTLFLLITTEFPTFIMEPPSLQITLERVLTSYLHVICLELTQDW